MSVPRTELKGDQFPESLYLLVCLDCTLRLESVGMGCNGMASDDTILTPLHPFDRLGSETVRRTDSVRRSQI